MSEIDSLAKELEVGRKEIKTDSYHMSIGEIINMYKEGDIKLNPAFQRLFRWKDIQKTRFVESILLGIPIPPIFVAQKPNGKWTIVDGVQRISTILQLIGALPDKEPLVLTEAKKLPSLVDLTWETLSIDIQRIIKRSKLGVNIILTENSIEAQYELFQRLNTGGSHLEPQEIRNCLIIMLSSDFYELINNLKEYENFKDSLQLSETKFEIEHHMELILRYMIARRNKVNFESYSLSKDLLSDFIDNESKNLISDSDFDINNEISLFKEVFDYIKSAISKETFKKYNFDKEVFEGPFLESSFEAILPGLAGNFEKIKSLSKDEFSTLISLMYNEEAFTKAVARGKKAIARIQELTEFSYNYFSKA